MLQKLHVLKAMNAHTLATFTLSMSPMLQTKVPGMGSALIHCPSLFFTCFEQHLSTWQSKTSARRAVHAPALCHNMKGAVHALAPCHCMQRAHRLPLPTCNAALLLAEVGTRSGSNGDICGWNEQCHYIQPVLRGEQQGRQQKKCVERDG